MKVAQLPLDNNGIGRCHQRHAANALTTAKIVGRYERLK
jgi:hypothetical protein